VDRLPADDLLAPAEDAVREKAGVSPVPVQPGLSRSAGMPEGWVEFALQYCTAWGANSDDNSDRLAYAAITAMTRGVREGHTRFLTPDMYRDHQAWAAGDARYQGIGVRLRNNPLGVQYIFPDSPAEHAGLMLGDDILAIDGRPTSTLPAAEAVQLVRGEAGTSVRLTVQRPGVESEWDMDIARASIKIPVIESRMIGDLGYIHLTGFPTTDLPGEFRSALLQLGQQGAKALVFDLRGNSGGRLDVGTQIASYFLPQNTPLYRQTTRRGQTTTMTALNQQRIWDKPMVALIDDGTASMGEIMAAALQEESGTTLIGGTTAGSVAGSIVVPLSDGSALQITTLRIDSGQGTHLNTIGVQPDLKIEQTTEDSRIGRDHALDTAVDVLHTRLANDFQPQAGSVSGPSTPAQPAGMQTPAN